MSKYKTLTNICVITSIVMLLSACMGQAAYLPYLALDSLKSREPDKYSAFNTAVREGNLQFVKAQVAKDTIPLRRNEGFPEYTVSLALFNGQLSILKFLIDEYGWEVNRPLTPPAISTAADVARSRGEWEILRYLLSKGAVLDTTPQLNPMFPVLSTLVGLAKKDPSDRKERVRVAAYLISIGEPVNVISDSIPDTALQLAARAAFPEMIELLLKHGADVNMKSPNGWTALDFANSVKCQACVDLLNRHVK